MKPYYQDDYVTIYHGDCLGILPSLKDVDLTITSPPFNLGDNHHTNAFRHRPYGDAMPEDEYQAWQEDVLGLVHTATSPHGSFFYQHKNRLKAGALISPYDWLRRSQWVVKQEIVWHNGSPNMDNQRFYPFTERVYWLAMHSGVKLVNAMKLTDDWHIAPVGSEGGHTRAFPDAIPTRIIAALPSAVLILDPFLGSGTTAVAAKKLNRKCTGIEIEEQYCEIAAKRCSQSVMELGL